MVLKSISLKKKTKKRRNWIPIIELNNDSQSIDVSLEPTLCTLSCEYLSLSIGKKLKFD